MFFLPPPQAALLQTKAIKETSSPSKSTSVAYAADDEKWIRKVIDEEQVKPLEVSKDFVLEYEKREKQNADRLSSQVERHISTLKKLRERLEQRQDVKQRSEEYRTWQRSFAPKKLAVYSGKTLDEAEEDLMRKSQGGAAGSRMSTGVSRATAGAGGDGSGNGKAPELGAVLDSLNKLAELENRISSLEQDNQYDYLVGKEKGARKQPGEDMFKKKRIPIPAAGVKAPQAPMGVRYQMQQKPSPRKQSQQQRSSSMGQSQGYGQGQGQGQSMGRGSGIAAVKASRQLSGAGGASGGTFLTGMDYGTEDEMSDAEAARRDRRRQQAQASEGQKNLRSRVQARKAQAKEVASGARKHDAAIREMQTRKSNISFGHRTDASMQSTGGASRYTSATRTGPTQAPMRGAASGMKTKNKYLQEFEKIKAGFSKRKEAKKLGTKFTGGGSLPPIAASRPQGRVGGAYGGSKRVPATQVGGTVTRRAVVPTNRKTGGGGFGATGTATSGTGGGPGGGPVGSMSSSMPVGGVAGIRALQGMQAGRGAGAGGRGSGR